MTDQQALKAIVALQKWAKKKWGYALKWGVSPEDDKMIAEINSKYSKGANGRVFRPGSGGDWELHLNQG